MRPLSWLTGISIMAFFVAFNERAFEGAVFIYPISSLNRGKLTIPSVNRLWHPAFLTKPTALNILRCRIKCRYRINGDFKAKIG